MATMTSKLACAVPTLAALVALAGCDSLKNPDHPVVETVIGADGRTALFFYDGVGIADPALNVVRFVPYPVLPVRMGLHGLSRNGARALVSWNDEGNQQAPDGGVTPPSDKPNIDVFDVPDGRLVRSFQVGHYALALSEDGARLVVAGTANEEASPPAAPPQFAPTGTLIAFNVDDGSRRWSVPGAFQSVVTIPGANAVAALPINGDPPASRLLILDLDTGATRREIPLADFPEGLAVSPDGGLLVVGRVEIGLPDTQAANAHFILINVADGATVREVSLSGRSPWENMAVSSDGRFIAAIVGLDGPSSSANPRGPVRELVLWDGDAVTMRTPTDLTGMYPRTVALSPDSAVLVAAQSDGVGLYDVLTGVELARRHYKQNLF
jgi:hypothetical protein